MSQVTLKELIMNADFHKNILPILEKHYEFYLRKEGVQRYYRVFQQLKQMNSVPSDCEIYIDKHGNVSGYKVDENGQEQFYAIEYTPWKEWLGMKIHFDTLLRYNDYEIIAHCIWEMTWVSFDEKKIQAKTRELNDLLKDIEVIPIEDVLVDNEFDAEKLIDELLNDTLDDEDEE